MTSCGMVFASSVPQRGRDPHSAPVLPRGHRRALLHGDGEGRCQGIAVLNRVSVSAACLLCARLLARVCSFVTSVGWECTTYQVYDARINCNLKSQVLFSDLHVCAACARVWCGSDHTGLKGLAHALGCQAIYRSSSMYAHMISTATIRKRRLLDCAIC